MFDSETLHIGELAERWTKTPRQILDLAQGLRVPLYFHFEGLAFDVTDHWRRHGGDSLETLKIEILSADITRRKAQIRRSARGEIGQWEQQLSSEDAKEIRPSIEADEIKRAALVDLLEQRQQDRQKMFYRGFMRAGPSTLFAIAAHQVTPFPIKAFHPHSPIKIVTMADARHDGEQIWEGRLMALEPLPGYESRPAKPLTADDLYALTAEVKAIESFMRAKQTETQPQAATPPAPVVDAPACEVRPAATGPQFTMTKAAMIEQHKHEWPTIERDIADAKRNGLADAAKAGAREWREANAMEWARSKNKLVRAEKPVNALGRVINQSHHS